MSAGTKHRAYRRRKWNKTDFWGSSEDRRLDNIKVPACIQNELQRFIEQVGITRQSQNGPCNNVFVSVGGRLKADNRYWLFLARHDGAVPDNWGVLERAHEPGPKPARLGRGAQAHRAR
jgi:hypothetical protein